MATIKEQLQEVRNWSWDLLGIKPPHSSLFIKSLDGKVLTYEHYLPFSKQKEFISNFVKEHPDIRLFQVERVKFPNNLNSSLSREIYQEISTFEAPNQALYKKNKVPDCDYIYDATSQKTYPPFHKWNSLPEITQIELVSVYPIGIDKIKDPSEAVQMAAIKKNPGCITLLDSPCETVQIYVAQQDPFVISLISPTEKTILTAVEKDPSVVEKDPSVLESIKNPSEEFQLQIAKLVPTAIKYIDNPNEEIQLIAVERNPYAINDIAYPTEKVQLIAIRKEYNVLSEINGPTPQVCKIAIEQLYNNKVTIDISSLPSIDSFCRDSRILIDNISTYPTQKQRLLSVFENKYFPQKSNEVDITPVSNNKEIIGEISYYGFNGEIVETLVFNNVDRYLNCIKEGLDVNPTGFTYKTLIENAEVRKATDDIVYGAFGIDNPHGIEWYDSKHSEKDIIRQLDRLGISSSEQKVIANELLTVGKTSNLISINTNVLEQKLELPARLSLDGEGNIKVHLVRKSLKEDLEKPYMGHIFTPVEKEALLTNKNAGGVITINSLNGQQQKVLVSVDRLTGELLSLPIDKVKIPDRYKGVELSEENKSILATGEPCVIKGVPAGKWAKYDVTVQYSVDSKGIVSLPRLDKVTTIGETVLSERESQALREGKTIQVSNLVDDRGQKYSAYVKIKQPDNSLVVTPTNQHRVQVNHNTHGIKTDENKKAEKKADSFGIKSGKSKVEYNKSKKQPKVKH